MRKSWWKEKIFELLWTVFCFALLLVLLALLGGGEELGGGGDGGSGTWFGGPAQTKKRGSWGESRHRQR